MAFRFEDLKVWLKAAELSNEIDLLARQFPVEERFNLASQIKRAADSVVLNIAEGSTGQSVPEFKRFLNIARRIINRGCGLSFSVKNENLYYRRIV